MPLSDDDLAKLHAAPSQGGLSDDDLASQFAAPKASRITKLTAPPDQPKSFLDRVKNALIVPESQREKPSGTWADGIQRSFQDIPNEMGKESSQALSQLGHDIETPWGGPTGTSKLLAKTGALGLDVLNYAASPFVGAAASIAGRPIEMGTGLKREITGNALTALIPGGGEEKAASEIGEGIAASEKLRPAVQRARNAGYVLPPQMISDKPGPIANALAGWSGKIKTQQAASVRNQEITNQLAAKALGLPETTTLDESVFRNIRKDAGKAYEAVKNAIPEITADADYVEQVSALGGANSQAAQYFPNITKNQGILDLAEELKNTKTFPTAAGVEVVRELRSSASANLKALGDPSKHALGLAQRQAAEAIDDLMDRNISASGNPGLIKEYRAARKLIAKSHDVESVTNSATGDVNALGLAKLADKGKPLTDELATIADSAAAFPKAMQPAARFGGDEKLSGLDFFGSALALGHGNPGIAAAIMGRPIARNIILSKIVQNHMAPAQTGMDLLKSFAQTAPKTRQLLSGGRQNSLVPLLSRAPAINALRNLTYQSNQQ